MEFLVKNALYRFWFTRRSKVTRVDNTRQMVYLIKLAIDSNPAMRAELSRPSELTVFGLLSFQY